MKRNKLSFIFILLILFLLVGCKSQINSDTDYVGNEGYDDTTEKISETTPHRKIIYKVSAELTTSDMMESVNTIKNELNSDEWLDSESITNNSAELVIRVKSSHLEEFLNAINDSHEVSNYRKTATDISLNYQDKTNLLLTYEKERERLLELYETASLSDMMTINQRLSQIEIEIGKLQGDLNEFDSLVDYSEVRLNIYLKQNEKKETLSFGNKLSKGFSSGLQALIMFLETLLIVAVTLLPWTIVFLPIGFGIYFMNKRHKKKQSITHIVQDQEKK